MQHVVIAFSIEMYFRASVGIMNLSGESCNDGAST